MHGPDPIDHAPACPAIESGQWPALYVKFTAGENGTVAIDLWEQCQGCTRAVRYHREREPWRRFHRTWRAHLATWLATWEHRHQVGDRLTGS